MRIFILLLSVFFTLTLQSQSVDKTIQFKRVKKIEEKLAADAMEGRETFKPGNDKAAEYIAREMKKAGLKEWDAKTGYYQWFEMIKAEPISQTASVGGQVLSAEQIQCFSTQPNIQFTEADGYKVVRVAKSENFGQKVGPLLQSSENILVLIDTSFKNSFQRLARFKRPQLPKKTNLVFLLAPDVSINQYAVNISQQTTPLRLRNVVGLLPGKSRPKEMVIFSGHYDHLGYGKPNESGDSLYNGANDDAAGITGMLLLGRHYSKLKDNERTLAFVAFTAEEIGGYGSSYFSEQINPNDVVAMLNLEMIGTESKWGKNSAYITGFEKSDLGAILQKNLEGTVFKFHPDPYPDQKLFYRSDNANLAKKGVPAHTISTSKMDSEPHYHKASDEVSTLDLKNMTEVIKAIALSSAGLVSGKDTPTRVAKEGE